MSPDTQQFWEHSQSLLQVLAMPCVLGLPRPHRAYLQESPEHNHRTTTDIETQE